MQRYILSDSDGSLRQGEILEGIRELSFDTSQLSQRSFQMKRPWSERVSHPWSIVLTPDCDLEWDFLSRLIPGDSENKRVNHLLLCDLEDRFSIERDGRIKNSGELNRARTYREERWHYLPASLTDDGQDLVEFYIDFKRLFSVPIEFVYAAMHLGLIQRHGYLNTPWVQHLTHRFTYFLGRVGLPDEQ